MRATSVGRFLAVPAALLAASLLIRYGISADKAPPKKQPASDPKAATTQSLGGENRFLTYLSTDKPIYRAGEKVYLRGVMLDAHSRKPLGSNQPVQVQIVGPKGDIITTSYSQAQDSVVGFAWPVPEGQAGGEYTAKITHPGTGYPPAERKFDIRAYRAPRLKSQIEFVRKGYGPGDAVSATLKVERAEGGIPAEAKVTILARLDGQQVYREESFVDGTGLCSTRFELPAEIARGEGTLAFVIEDGGIVETASKTIPILLQTVDLQMYPEGGDLVAGLSNRLYLEARTPAQKPADIAGEIVDEQGAAVAEFRTSHEGRGRVEFTPRSDAKYSLRITEPAGIKTQFPLPAIRAEGVVISAASDVTAAGKPVSLQLAATRTGEYKVTLSRREQQVASTTRELTAGQARRITLDPADAEGILIATVWNSDGTPLAERLVFRQPARSVNVTVKADKPTYTPGSTAHLTITTTDADGKPLSAVVGLSVTDDSVQEMIDKREQAPRLPVMVLLENDVRELADAHVYFDPQNPDAPRAVDLLLGTQGWRRFAFVKTPDFLAKNGDDARRVLALSLATVREKRQSGLAFPGRRFRGAIMEKAAAKALPQAAVPPAPQDGAAAVEELKEHAQNKPQANALEANGRPANAAKPDAPPAESRAAEPRADADFDDRQVRGNAEAAAAAAPLREALEQADRVAGKRALIAGDEAQLGLLRRRVANPYAIVREYAHQVRPNRQPGERTDFAETLYWHAGIRTDEKTGQATVEFGMSDAVTSFRVNADAFTSEGALGTLTTQIESVEPFYLEPKLPLEVTSGDVIQLPLGIVNASADDLSSTQVQLEAKGLSPVTVPPFDLPADTRVRRIAALNVGQFSGTTDVLLKGQAGPYADSSTRKLVVKPLGFPQEIGKGGMLYADDTKEHEIVIPGQIVPGSLTTKAVVYPTPMANLTEALERLIREPYGCFEQTSSSTYPLVMAQQYFQSHAGIDPDLIKRSNAMLEKGYNRLIGFECKQGGYEWFGQDPGHEALTAYGLLEFSDMAQVFSVDSEMVSRTRAWLLKQRDGNGGFARKRRALHTWVSDPDVSNAYILWALVEAGEKQGLEAEIGNLMESAAASPNTYVKALAANVLFKAGHKDAATELLDQLIPLQELDGHVKGGTQTIVGSGGQALEIETTALAALAWLNDREYIDFTDKAIRWLASTCESGRFGSTQSTVLALRAIVAYDKAQAHPKAPGSLQLLVDGKPVGEPVAFDTKTQGTITLPDFSSLLTPGKHTVAVKMDGGSSMPHSVTVNVNTTRPNSAEECKVQLEVALRDANVTEGGLTEAEITCWNRTQEIVPTPVAIIGIPGGLEVRHDQLKELVKSEKIAAYEVLGREVVLYWRAMEADQKVTLPLSLVAAIPGDYTAPASRAYLYYTDEHKQWVDPLHVSIAPRNE